jgi:predicted permease
MLDVINLALPFFGLMFIGFACGKLKPMAGAGLAWMDFFILYVALPAMFYRILATTPLEQLARPWFIVGTTLSAFVAFVLAFGAAMALRHGQLAQSTMAGLAGGYGNIGYMAPGVALSTLGAGATPAVALIFCFDQLLLFTLVPFLMALSGSRQAGALAIAATVAQRLATHPLIIASVLGVLSAAVRFEPPVALDRLLQFLQNAAAPCALFTLGVTVAMRPLKKVPLDVMFPVVIKLVVHPAIVLALLILLGPFDELWVYTAVLTAALPPALNVFIFARQYNVWVEQASSAILVGTVASVVTLTTVMWLVKTHQLPVAFH